MSDEDAALFESLTPDLARALYPEQIVAPFRVTAIYPKLGGEAGKAAARLEAAAEADEIVEASAGGETPLHRTTFSLRQVEDFHELYHLLESTIGAVEIDLLLNDKKVPLARELWLPLLWTLRR